VRRSSAALLLALGIAGALAGPAPAAPTTSVDARLAVEGQIVVEYRSAAGLEGTATFDPGGEGQLLLRSSGAGSRRRVRASLFLFRGLTVVQATRGLPDGTGRACADARDTFSALDATTRGSRPLAIRPGADTDLVGTRCAGPLPADVAGALPSAEVDPAALGRDGATIDLHGDRRFAAGGIEGTVHSSLRFRVLHPRTRHVRPRRAPDRRPARHRTRVLSLTYVVERAAGSVRTRIRGVSDPTRCGPLDACGLAGTFTERLAGAGGRIRIVATGRADRVSAAGLRAAAGLGGGRRPRGINVYGFGGWRTPGATLTADLTRSDGEGCRDVEAVPRADLLLQFRAGRVLTQLSSAADRTRCPGPRLAGTYDDPPQGSVPLRAFGGRRVVLRLRTPRSSGDDAYRLVSQPDAVIVLRRVRRSERVTR
jgi:hypothetical protein